MQTLSVSICAQFALSTTPAEAGQHSSHFVMTIPAAADPGWTLELGRDGGRDRDGSLYCPKTQDSLNAQRVQFPYWSGDLELHHPSAKTDPGPRHLPRVSGGVFTTGSVLHGYTGHSQPCHCHCCCFSLFNLFLVFSREPRPRTGDSESWDQNKP